MRFARIATTLVSLLWCVVASAQSTSFKYVSINYPNSVTTNAFGINNYNSIVGAYQTAAGGVHGFKYNGGHFTSYSVPGAIRTIIQGISDTGDMVGWYATSSTSFHGFLYHAGHYTTIDVPGNVHGTFAMGINKQGTIVGRWLDVAGNYHGFTWIHGAITKYDLNGDVTSLNGISNLGVIVGQNLNSDFWRSFLKTGSDVDYLFPVPSSDNEAYGVNGHGDVVGCSTADASGYVVYTVEVNEGSESTEKMKKPILLTYPGALQTCASGINYNRSIVGSFTDSKQHLQGFLAVPQ
jgi:hypothetical protein